MKSISMIVAIAENYAIGRDNQLLWHLPEDLKRFKRITNGHHIIMGKNTFYSLPNGQLPGRTNIVLTSQREQIDGCSMARSIEDAIAICSESEENFIIGGGRVYQLFFPIAQKLYITKVHASFEADTFFPEIAPSVWEITDSEYHKADEKHKYDYTFITYRRK